MIDGQAKPKEAKNKKLMLVRYGRIGLLGWFEHQEPRIPRTAARVMVKTDRGLELGEIVGPFCYRGGQFRMSCEQLEEYFGQDESARSVSEGGRFIRFATEQDLIDEKHLAKSEAEEMQTCQCFADELGLSMRVVDSEHLFGGERIVFYFVAEGRIDFRELVKRLAKEYQTRIELRQIGSRDQSRLVVDYETCGLECCCRRFLWILKPVNMKMAKLQKATLDPAKISGHCGRLKCCLRYEDETYMELRKRLPRKNTLVKCANRQGKVVDVQILAQRVVVQTEDGTQFAVPVEEIEVLAAPVGGEAEEEAVEQTGGEDRPGLPAEAGGEFDTREDLCGGDGTAGDSERQDDGA
jgi:cell fate regulator YaaT (PSP1 superfamily)